MWGGILWERATGCRAYQHVRALFLSPPSWAPFLVPHVSPHLSSPPTPTPPAVAGGVCHAGQGAAEQAARLLHGHHQAHLQGWSAAHRRADGPHHHRTRAAAEPAAAQVGPAACPPPTPPTAHAGACQVVGCMGCSSPCVGGARQHASLVLISCHTPPHTRARTHTRVTHACAHTHTFT